MVGTDGIVVIVADAAGVSVDCEGRIVFDAEIEIANNIDVDGAGNIVGGGGGNVDVGEIVLIL